MTPRQSQGANHKSRYLRRFLETRRRVSPPRSPERLSQSGHPRVQVPIRAKITLPYLILSLVLAIGAAYLVSRIVFDTIEERFVNQLVEGGKLAGEWMVREEGRLLETLRLLANVEGIAPAVAQGDAERVRELAFAIAVNSRAGIAEFIDEREGIVLSLRRLEGGGPEEYEFTRGGVSIAATSGSLRKVLAGEVDELGDKFSGYLRTDQGAYFYVTGPIIDDQGALVGAVLVGRPLAEMLRQMREETLAQITVYDFEGRPQASTFFAPAPLSPADAAEVLKRQHEGSFRREVSLQRDVTIGTLGYTEILGPWEVRGGHDLGVLGASFPRTFLVHASRITRLQVFLVVTGALMLVILVGVQVANLITRPLMGLVRASTQVARGDLGVRVEAAGRDEVAILAESFNQMIASLKRSKAQLIQAYDDTIEGWSKALDLRDRETEGHSQRVTEMTLRLARAMGMSADELEHVRRGALLHDIGKMGVPDAILLKEGPLTDEEWAIMRRHPELAREMLWPIQFLRPAIDIPYCHHERWDGAGYPRGLKGEEIPLAARIFAVVDVWDAMRSHRPYRPALSEEEALRVIQEGSGTHFDAAVVEMFVRMTRGELADPGQPRSAEQLAGASPGPAVKDL